MALVPLVPFLGLVLSSGCGPTRPLPAPPVTRTAAAVTTYHGVPVSDSYRWLDDAGAPEVQRWIDAENAYTDTVLAGFPEGKALTERVRQLLGASPERSAPELEAGTLFYEREVPPAAQPVLVAQTWPDGVARTLVDPNRAGGNLALTAFWPSPGGRYVAYGTTEDGKQVTTLHVLAVGGARLLADTIPGAGGGPSPQALLWDPDERGFTYARYPLPVSGAGGRAAGGGALEPFDVALYHHILGQPFARDPAVLGAGLSPIAEYRLLGSADARAAAALVNVGDGSPAAVYVRGARGWRRAADTTLGVRTAAFVGARLLVTATAGTPRGRLVALAPDGRMSVVLPQGERVLWGIAPIAGGFLATTLWGPDWRLDQYTSAGTLVRAVPLPPGVAVGAIASSAASPQALVTYSGWSVPERWVRYDGASGALTPAFAAEPAVGDTGVLVHRLNAVSKDGTRVPVTVLALAGTPRTGSAPAILTSYGGFDIPVAPAFIGPWLAWLERGGVLAYANIRGGAEFGESWHDAGRLTRKQNVFDDFYAAAEALVRERWTAPERLGILGASNGGLLMGAELTQHPEQFRAVVSFVGIYDMLRHEDFPNGRYNVPEYGTVADSAEFAALYAYAPLYHVVPGARYPAVLLETGANDPLVAPWQSREFAARLQAAAPRDRPVLLLTRFHAGHGSSSFSQRVGNAAIALTFFAHELGLGPER